MAKLTWNKGLRKKMIKKYKKKLPFNRRQAKAIKRLAASSGEIKESFDTGTDTSVVEKNGFVFTSLYSDIIQGDANNERIGDKIKIKDYSIKLEFNSGTASCCGKVYIIESLDDIDISTFSSTMLGTLTDINSFLPSRELMGSRYKVHATKSLNISTSGKKDQHMYFKIKPKYKTLCYQSATGAPIQNGQIFILTLTNNATASQITSSVNVRLRYYDN